MSVDLLGARRTAGGLQSRQRVVEVALERMSGRNAAEGTWMQCAVSVDVDVPVARAEASDAPLCEVSVGDGWKVAVRRIDVQPVGKLLEHSLLRRRQGDVSTCVPADRFRLEDLDEARAEMARRFRVSLEVVGGNERTRWTE
jgi:hypothetical protein